MGAAALQCKVDALLALRRRFFGRRKARGGCSSLRGPASVDRELAPVIERAASEVRYSASAANLLDRDELLGRLRREITSFLTCSSVMLRVFI